MQEQQMLLAELSTHPRHPHVLPGLSLSPLPPSTHPLALNPCACGSKILRCTQNKSKMAFIVFYQSRVTLSQQGFLFFKLGLLLLVLLDSKHVNGC